MKWIVPSTSKVYEALSCVADGRVVVDDSGSTNGIINAKVTSSSGGKVYDVSYSPDTNEIMANDNGSYWKGYLGYPSIALLMLRGVLPLNDDYSKALAGVKWKELSTKFRGNFDGSLVEVRNTLVEKGVVLEEFDAYLQEVVDKIKELGIEVFGARVSPPVGY